jgi:hypothetical protein
LTAGLWLYSTIDRTTGHQDIMTFSDVIISLEKRVDTVTNSPPWERLSPSVGCGGAPTAGNRLELHARSSAVAGWGIDPLTNAAINGALIDLCRCWRGRKNRSGIGSHDQGLWVESAEVRNKTRQGQRSRGKMPAGLLVRTWCCALTVSKPTLSWRNAH